MLLVIIINGLILTKCVVGYFDYLNWDPPLQADADEYDWKIFSDLGSFFLLNLFYSLLIHASTIYLPILGPGLALVVVLIA